MVCLTAFMRLGGGHYRFARWEIDARTGRTSADFRTGEHPRRSSFGKMKWDRPATFPSAVRDLSAATTSMAADLAVSPYPMTPDERSFRREFGWFMLFALVVLAAGIGMRDPWPPDEPRFALVARQMLESGQWLFPHRGMELYADKPPLLMWTEAVWMWLTGGWRGAFLLTSLFSGLGTLALVAYLGRRHQSGASM